MEDDGLRNYEQRLQSWSNTPIETHPLWRSIKLLLNVKNSSPSPGLWSIADDFPRNFCPNLEFWNLGPIHKNEKPEQRPTKHGRPSRTICPWIPDSTLIISKLIDKCWFWLFSSDCSFCGFFFIWIFETIEGYRFCMRVILHWLITHRTSERPFKKRIICWISETHRLYLRKIWSGILTDISCLVGPRFMKSGGSGSSWSESF